MIDALRVALQKEQIKLNFPDLSKEIHTLTRLEPSACKVACPAGVDVKAYIGLIIAGKFDEALEVVKKNNPLPGICGRVCTHPCESECNRRKVDEPVAICALKRFIADWELKNGKKKSRPVERTKKEKVAIVGSGPAGLTCANDLIRKGYGVTIFEALSLPGGMLTAGIPPFRLPREIIQTEIEAITGLGVELLTNTKVGEDIGLDELLKKDYQAVFMAIGAHKGLKLGIPGEGEYQGILDAVDFLRRVNTGDKTRPGRRAIIIGGGNSAIDASRTALRLGCEEITIVYRRSRKEMPAAAAEIEEAEREGVKLRYLTAPVRVLGKNGKVVGMECVKMRLGEPDSSGRRRPIPLEGSEFTIEADVIIPAISQKPDISFLPKKFEFRISKWDTFEVDPVTFATNIPGFFAGGDAVTGPSTVIDAITHGHFAARSIDRYISHKDLKKGIGPAPKLSEWGFKLEIEDEKPIERNPIPRLPLEQRLNGFEEVDLCFTEEMAVAEAKRCLRCGPCIECRECVPGCSKRLVMLHFPEESSQKLENIPEFILRVPYDPKKLPWDERSKKVLLSWIDEEEKKRELSLTMEPIVCYVDRDLCRGCGECVKICEYHAAELKPCGDGTFVSEIDQALCKGCDTCLAACPSGAIKAKHFTSQRIERLIDSCLSKNERKNESEK